jgi:hypothetical protein
MNDKNNIVKKNRDKFDAIRQISLPPGQYAITGSGALGIRNLREIADIDIIVTSELWSTLAAKYGVTEQNRLKKIVFPNQFVEAFNQGSFYEKTKDKDAPTVAFRIASADIIEGLPFESLEHVLYYKRRMGREKDLNDILLIENFLREHAR